MFITDLYISIQYLSVEDYYERSWPVIKSFQKFVI